MDTFFLIFLLGFFFALSIYHLLVYFGRKKDLSNLAFSILCFSYIFILSVIIFFPKNIILKHLVIIPIAGGTALFTHSIFYLKKIMIFSITFFIVIILLEMASTIIYIVIKNELIFFLLFYPSTLIYALIFTILVTYNIIKNKQYKTQKEKFVILGNIILLLSMIVFSFFRILNILFNPFISFSPFLIMTLVFAYALTSSFNQEHQDLIDLKSTLEQKVLDLTTQKTNAFVNLTHELKTPLTILWNVINDYIKQKGEDKEIRIIKNNADDAVKKINSFLSAEKLFQGKNYNQEQINDLSKIINDKKESFEYNARIKKLDIYFNIENGIYIKAGSDSIHHIINNLIENAIKYTDHGKIDVELKADNDNIMFTISDTGMGIPEELQEKIFEPYYQITHEKKNIQGVGMGLNIVKGMVDLLKGQIELTSKLDKGTKIIVTLKRYHLKQDEIVDRNT
jgi:signal transduction histidine kinase